MIPKVIHYCWFGRGKLSPEIEMCIASWKRFCPNYEIRRWDEDNSPMDIPWVHDAYKHRKYAFVADYVRFYALYMEGGVYMDTDMLLIKPIDEFLNDGLFLGREDQYNASFGIVGAEAGNDFCKECLNFYDSTPFDLVHPPIITRFVSPRLVQYGFTEEDTTQRLSNGLIVYQSSYFYPIHYTQSFELQEITPPYSQGQYIVPERFRRDGQPTYGIHLWNKSWTDEFALLQRGDYREGFRTVKERFLHTPFLPFGYWKKVIKYGLLWLTNRNKRT